MLEADEILKLFGQWTDFFREMPRKPEFEF